MERKSLPYLRQAALAGVHRVVFDEAGEGWKDLRAPLVPHGALSASDCQSVSPCGAHAALLGSVPSLRRPPQLLLRHPAFCSASKAPRTFLFHCNPKGSTLMVHV
ncbi:CAD protein [Dissostichus eleginoides]|uniref:CAD protein n=1 Tax=Dissostichus eleginoides TaxID=100907 RepID=A0AAD9BH02_DISEL|nr:CAD protein [Dissostichus eleginoides]